MSKTSAQAARVGILVAVALVLLMAAVTVIGEGQNFWERRVNYEVHVARTNGLKVGAPVALSGVGIGSVVRIQFPEHTEARYIRIEIRASRSVADRIREDSIASIHTQGVLGDKYIEISPGSLEVPPREPGTVIPAVDPVDYESVLGRSGDIVANILELTASLRNVLQAIDRGEGLIGAIVRNREQGELTFADIQETMANLSVITARVENMIESVERGEGLLGALVRDTERAEGILTRLTQASVNLDEFTESLNTSNGLLPRLLEDEELGEQILADVKTTTANLASLTDKLESSEGTLGKLVNDPALYDESTELVRSVRKSWLLGVFRGIRGLWPFEGRTPSAAKDGDPSEAPEESSE